MKSRASRTLLNPQATKRQIRSTTGIWDSRHQGLLPHSHQVILLALVTILSQWLAPIPGAQVLLEFAPAQQRWSAGHRGVDFAGDTGTRVHAIGPGRVIFAGTIAGKPVISIEHPELGLRSTYEPVSGVVRRGDVVSGGQVIGAIARVGGHCADRCLHLGLKAPGHGEYRDPLDLLDSRYAVLKPLSG